MAIINHLFTKVKMSEKNNKELNKEKINSPDYIDDNLNVLDENKADITRYIDDNLPNEIKDQIETFQNFEKLGEQTNEIVTFLVNRLSINETIEWEMYDYRRKTAKHEKEWWWRVNPWFASEYDMFYSIKDKREWNSVSVDVNSNSWDFSWVFGKDSIGKKNGEFFFKKDWVNVKEFSSEDQTIFISNWSNASVSVLEDIDKITWNTKMRRSTGLLDDKW